MKKLITLLLILAMLPVIALADLPDISGLSTDDLIELNHQIQLRLFSEQLVSGVKVPPGSYVIGEDIPAGTYRVDFPVVSDLLMGLFMAYTEDYSDYVTYYIGENNTTAIGKVELKEGMTLEISDTTAIFYAYTGLFN